MPVTVRNVAREKLEQGQLSLGVGVRMTRSGVSPSCARSTINVRRCSATSGNGLKMPVRGSTAQRKGNQK
jgi:hypothetical protein